MQISRTKFLSHLFAITLATSASIAVAGSIDATKSQITANFRQMNVPIEGRFGVFRGAIVFDPRNATAGRAQIEIDTASFDVGAPEYNDELRTKEWLDTSTYPKASFVSSRVISAAENRFEATGKFSLKGKTVEIKIPFTQRAEGGLFIYEGEFPLSRKTYSIGSAAWDKTVDDKVIVKFRITAVAK